MFSARRYCAKGRDDGRVFLLGCLQRGRLCHEICGEAFGRGVSEGFAGDVHPREWRGACGLVRSRLIGPGGEKEFFPFRFSLWVSNQTGQGHFSPIGGMLEAQNKALVLDVARFKYPPHWLDVGEVRAIFSTCLKALSFFFFFVLSSCIVQCCLLTRRRVDRVAGCCSLAGLRLELLCSLYADIFV